MVVLEDELAVRPLQPHRALQEEGLLRLGEEGEGPRGAVLHGAPDEDLRRLGRDEAVRAVRIVHLELPCSTCKEGGNKP